MAYENRPLRLVLATALVFGVENSYVDIWRDGGNSNQIIPVRNEKSSDFSLVNTASLGLRGSSSHF